MLGCGCQGEAGALGVLSGADPIDEMRAELGGWSWGPQGEVPGCPGMRQGRMVTAGDYGS